MPQMVSLPLTIFFIFPIAFSSSLLYIIDVIVDDPESSKSLEPFDNRWSQKGRYL